MPPRIPATSRLATQCSSCFATPNTTTTPSLARLLAALSLTTTPWPAMQVQARRHASVLNDLRDNSGAYHKRIRVGRGPSSGYGKTSGRGQKGQKAHGHVHPWFQGGQTPLLVSRGRLGFVNKTKLNMSEININKLQEWIDLGRISATELITPRELIRSRLVGSIRDGIKLLARGKETLKQPVTIVVSRASAAAIEAVEAAGGNITTRYYTKDSMRRLVQGKSLHTVEPLPVGEEHVERIIGEHRENMRKGKFYYRLPDPTSRWDIEYYRDPAHRGYLSHTLKEGQSPSLFFKIPLERPKNAKRREVEVEKKDVAKLWEQLGTGVVKKKKATK